MKIKIKKNTERIKNIIELKCNIELEIRFNSVKSWVVQICLKYFLALAVYCVSTPIILLTRVHVIWLVHK
jgi:hypothetical protein